MKKITTIMQLIIGVVVILFALILFWESIVGIIPAFAGILNPSSLPFRLSGMSAWVELVLSIFIIQVVAVYTKKLFDKLSVKG